MENTKHKGVNLHRLKPSSENPIEVAFAKKWAEWNEHGKVLEWTMNGIKNERSDLAERDYSVAATTIQWLGSPVGMSFLREVINSCPKAQEWLKAL